MVEAQHYVTIANGSRAGTAAWLELKRFFYVKKLFDFEQITMFRKSLTSRSSCAHINELNFKTSRHCTIVQNSHILYVKWNTKNGYVTRLFCTRENIKRIGTLRGSNLIYQYI